MKIKWNFLGEDGGEEVTKQKPSVGGVWMFSGTTQCLGCCLCKQTDLSYRYKPPMLVFRTDSLLQSCVSCLFSMGDYLYYIISFVKFFYLG